MNHSLSRKQTASVTRDSEAVHNRTQTVPVLILGSYITALGTIRGLGRHGIKSYAITPQLNYVLKSRYYNPPPDGYPLLSQASNLQGYLEDLPIEKAVIIPCDDYWLQAVADIKDLIAERFPTSLSGPKVLERFVDKASFLKLVEDTGVAHPQTYVLNSVADLGPMKEKEKADWFLKPADSQAFRTFYGKKAFRVQSFDDAVAKLEDALSRGYQMLLQEYVVGPSSNHYFIDGFVDRQHQVKAILTRNRKRMYPLDFGDSSYVESVPLDLVADTVETVKRMLEVAGFRGIFSAEFKRDERDGELRIIEVNARAWAYIEFASRCGVDIAWMAYLDALDREVPHASPMDRVKSLCFMPNDFFAYLALHRQGKLSTFKWLTSWLRAESTVFSWRDPAPSFKCWLDMGISKLRRTLGRTKTL